MPVSWLCTFEPAALLQLGLKNKRNKMCVEAWPKNSPCFESHLTNLFVRDDDEEFLYGGSKYESESTAATSGG